VGRRAAAPESVAGPKDQPRQAPVGPAKPAARIAVIVLLALWPVSLLLTGNAPKAFDDWTGKHNYRSLPPRSSAEGRFLGNLVQQVYEAKLDVLGSPASEAKYRLAGLRRALEGEMADLSRNPVEASPLEEFDIQMRFRDESIRSQIASGNKRVGVLYLLPPFPKTYVNMDIMEISHEPKEWLPPNSYWINKEFTSFYGLESIGSVDLR
jgi:hypothetical protein